MTRKRTVRRKWDLIDPLTHAVYQASKLTIAEWNRQVAPVITAVELLRSGDWNPEKTGNRFLRRSTELNPCSS